MSIRSEDSLAIQAPGEPSRPSMFNVMRALPISAAHRKVLYTFLTSFSVFASFAVQGIILANLLGRQGRGEYATTVFYPQILLYVGFLGAIEIVAWYAGQKNVDLLPLRRAAFRLGLFTGFLTMAVAIVLSMTLVPESKRQLIWLCLLCATALPFQSLLQVSIAVDRGSNNFSRYNSIRLFGALVLPLMLIVCWLTGQHSLPLICLLFVLSSIIGAIPCLWRMERKLSPAAPSIPRLLGKGKQYAVSMLASEIFERMDIAMFFFLTSLGTQGCYAAIVPAAHVLIIIPNALGMFTFNVGADAQRRVTVREATIGMAGTFVLQALIACAFAAVIGFLILLLYGEEFRPAIPLMYALIPAISIKGFLQGVEGYLKGRGKAHLGTYARLIAAVIMLACVYALRNTFELEGLHIPISAGIAQCFCLFWIVTAVFIDVIERNRKEDA
jgi:O-antigen/teichoic acid export membrane protein